MATQDVKIRITALDKTSGALRKIGSGLRALTKPLLNMRTALVGVIGAGGIGLLVKQSLSATDALAKTASKIGTTTEALSALQYAGQLTGVEVNTMNMALQRFTRRASEAAVGTGEAKGAIRELGIDARQLVRLPLDERMLVLADAFSNVQNESDRLRLAFKLFDSEGAALVNTLGLGREGLSDLLGEARSLGVVMSSNAAKGVEDANDALFRMQSLFGGVVKQTVAALAPAIAALADLITQKAVASFDEANEGVQGFAKALAVNLIDGVIKAVQGVQRISEAFAGIANFVIEFRRQINDAFSTIETRSLQGLEEQLERVKEQLAGYAAETNEAFKTNDAIVRDRERLRDALEAQIATIKALGEESDRTFTRFTGLDTSGIVQMLEQVRGAIDSTTESVSSLGATTNDVLPSAFESFIANLKRTRDLASDITPQLEALGDKAIRGLGDSFTDAITGAKNFSDAIRSMAKSVIDSLIRILVQKYLVDAAFGAITKAFAPSPSTSTAVSNPINDPFGDRQLAKGGVATAGRPYLVGEKGAELFVPNRTGRVVPNDQLGGGGVTVVQNINVTTGVQQTVRAEIATLLPQISNAAKAAVADSRMRGGGFSKAMGVA